MKVAKFSVPSAGFVAFLAMAAIGWQISAPPAPTNASAPPPEKTRVSRMDRKPRISPAAEIARRRVGEPRATADPEARLLAAIALANSLPPAGFAAWLDSGWFDLRGGPELMIFHKILMERWRQEDPDGLLAWAAKNKNGAAAGVMEEWAAKQPQRLIDWFKEHRDDRKELQLLANMAASSPDLALQRLNEMAAGGIAPNSEEIAGGLMEVLAEKSPAALTAVLGSLPAGLKIEAEAALSTRRMTVSLADEIQNLAARPDGWSIFTRCAQSSKICEKLMGELGNLPAEWLRKIGRNPDYEMGGSRGMASQWLETDLQGAGFSAAEIENIHGRALMGLAGADPESAVKRLGELDVSAAHRKEILDRAFSSGDPEALRALAGQPPTEEERQAANARLDQRMAQAGDKRVTGPDDLLAKIGGLDPENGSSREYFLQAKTWDAEKIAAVTAGFQALPDDKKRAAAGVISGNMRYSGAPQDLQGEAIRYLIDNPGPPENTSGWKSATAKSSQFAVQLMEKDPAAATAWVESLPAGEARDWSRKNLIDNWQQYDPQAARAFERSLPAADRATLAELGKKSRQ